MQMRRYKKMTAVILTSLLILNPTVSTAETFAMITDTTENDDTDSSNRTNSEGSTDNSNSNNDEGSTDNSNNTNDEGSTDNSNNTNDESNTNNSNNTNDESNTNNSNNTNDESNTNNSNNTNDESNTNNSDSNNDESNTNNSDSNNDSSITDNSNNNNNSENVDTSLGIITAITDSNGHPLKNSYDVTVPAGDSASLDELLWQLLRVNATLEGKTETVTLNVDWDYISLTANLDTPGEYTRTASILADGYTFADGVPQTLSMVITVTEADEKEPDVIQSFDSLENRYAYAVATNSDWQEFWDSYMAGGIWESSWICDTAEGETMYADILWENPEPDMSQSGIITVRGTAVLPENAVLAEGLTLPSVEVPVSIQSAPTLECWCADADVVYLPWVMGELENEDSLQFLASVNGEEWEDALEWVDTNGESVCVWICYLEEGSTYQVKVTWEGGETNVFEFTWEGAVTDAGPVEGDRDGGDNTKNPTGSIIQPAPTPNPEPSPEPEPTPVPKPSPVPEPTPVPEPSPVPDSTLNPDSTLEPDSTLNPDSALKPEASMKPDSSLKQETYLKPDSSLKADFTLDSRPDSSIEAETMTSVSIPELSTPKQKETFYEEVTDTYSRLSGTRLLMMRQTGAVRFSKSGITITLSDAALDSMALTDDTHFFIQIEKTAEGFVLTAQQDEVPLTTLTDTLVFYPYTSSVSGNLLLLLNEQGEKVCEGKYDAQMGVVTFTVQAPGRYTITEMVPQDEISPTQEISEKDQLFKETENVTDRQMTANEQEAKQFPWFLLILLLPLAGVATLVFFVRKGRR